MRDWLYVKDHVRALLEIAKTKVLPEKYLIGGGAEMSNIQIASIICDKFNDICGDSFDHKQLINFVDDRLGHDFRYAISGEKIFSDLGWKPKYDFSSALRDTIDWYLKPMDI